MKRHEGIQRRKIIFIFFIFFSATWGLRWGELFFIILSEVLATLFLLSWVVLYFSLRFLKVHRICPPRVFENHKVQITLEVEYDFFFPLSWIWLRDFFSPDHSHSKEFFIPSLRKEKKTLTYTGEISSGRGTYSLGPVEIRACDPLGLWVGRAVEEEKGQIIVLPEPVHLSSFFHQGAQSPLFSGSQTIHKAGLSYDFLGTREYRPGDHLKYIHWPATAHTGKMIIKEFQLHTSSQTTLLIDLYEKSLQGFKPNTLDYSVKILASLAKHACDQGQEFRLLGQGNRPFILPVGKGPGHLAWILEELAMVKPLGKMPLEEVIREFIPLFQPGEEVILTTSSHAMDPLKYIHIFTELQARRIYLTVILLVSKSFEKLWDGGQEGEFLTHETLPVFLAGRGIRVVAVEKGGDLVHALERQMG